MMKKYVMKCSCGDEMPVEAETREEAVSKIKAMMTQEMLDKHWADKHATDGMSKPTLQQAHDGIEANVKEVTA